jgi:hypothetical protein
VVGGAATFLRGLALWIAPTRPGEVPHFDAEARQRLTALGYLR